jgi:hypothetical protein
VTPQSALWLILGISLVVQAVMAPLTWQLRREIKLAQRNLDGYAGLGLVSSLLGFGVVALWWYYALATDQTLLAIIPTVGMVVGWLTRGMVTASKGKP